MIKNPRTKKYIKVDGKVYEELKEIYYYTDAQLLAPDLERVHVELPHDILVNIMLHADLYQITNMSGCSIHLNDVCQRPWFWKQIYNRDGITTCENVNKWIDNYRNLFPRMTRARQIIKDIQELGTCTMIFAHHEWETYIGVVINWSEEIKARCKIVDDTIVLTCGKRKYEYNIDKFYDILCNMHYVRIDGNRYNVELYTKPTKQHRLRNKKKY